MKALLSLVLLLFINMSVCAKSLGTFGQTYAIAEQDMLAWIEARLNFLEKNGELQQWQERMVDRARQSIQRPERVSGIRLAEKTRSFYYEPSIIVNEAIKDNQGQILVPVGTKVNPLERLPLSKQLLFIDGDDASQVSWALEKSRGKKTKIILINGSPIELMKAHNQHFYFDQKGLLVTKLGIKYVPAQVEQEQYLLKVTEVAL